MVTQINIHHMVIKDTKAQMILMELVANNDYLMSSCIHAIFNKRLNFLRNDLYELEDYTKGFDLIIS
jgi:hypothetical protein